MEGDEVVEKPPWFQVREERDEQCVWFGGIGWSNGGLTRFL